VFLWPFYAIDYALAEICALEYYQWANTDFSAAWKSYLNFCKESGSENFHQLILHAGLGDPFADGTLESLGEWLKEQITK
jgi:oligoendopeptidase F